MRTEVYIPKHELIQMTSHQHVNYDNATTLDHSAHNHRIHLHVDGEEHIICVFTKDTEILEKDRHDHEEEKAQYHEHDIDFASHNHHHGSGCDHGGVTQQDSFIHQLHQEHEHGTGCDHGHSEAGFFPEGILADIHTNFSGFSLTTTHKHHHEDEHGHCKKCNGHIQKGETLCKACKTRTNK